jgi:hypothetical protein
MNAARVSVNFAKRMHPAWKLARRNKKEKRQTSETGLPLPLLTEKLEAPALLRRRREFFLAPSNKPFRKMTE